MIAKKPSWEYLRKSVDSLRRSLRERDKTIMSLNATLSERIVEHDQQIEARVSARASLLTQKFRSQIQQLQQQIREQGAPTPGFESMQRQINELKHQKDVQYSQLVIANRRIEEMKNACSSEVDARKILDLQLQVEDLRQRKSRQAKTIESLYPFKEKFDALQQQSIADTDRINRLEAENHELQVRGDKLHRDFVVARHDARQARAELNTRGYSLTYRDLKEQYDKLAGMLESEKHANINFSKINRELNARIERMQEQGSTSHLKPKYEAALKQIDDLKKSLDYFQSESYKLGDENRKLVEEVTRLKNDFIYNEANVLRRQVKALQDKLERCKEYNAKLRRDETWSNAYGFTRTGRYHFPNRKVELTGTPVAFDCETAPSLGNIMYSDRGEEYQKYWDFLRTVDFSAIESRLSAYYESMFYGISPFKKPVDPNNMFSQFMKKLDK